VRVWINVGKKLAQKRLRTPI